ncbi:MAG: uroporphyrinogen decarboxylase family protein [Planctomycetota bacterium]
MNPRERLLTALNCNIPDRVPISTYELVGYNSQAWENNIPSYQKLMKAIREKTDCVCMWGPRSNATFLESSSPISVDKTEWRENHTTVCKRTLHTPEGPLTQTKKIMDGLNTVWQTEHLCKSVQDVDRALSIPYRPLSYDTSDYARIQQEVGNNGIIMADLADPLCLAAELMELGEYTVWAMTETKHFDRTIEILNERNMENLKRMLEINVVDLYRIYGPEYATPPFLPPKLFKKAVLPYVSKMVDLIHSKGAKARIHCHGRISEVLETILETGADAIDPCEGPPDGDITLADVKKRLYKKMCIFGNIQLKILENGSSDEVKNTVTQCLDSAKDGGGYVIMPTAAPINSLLVHKTEENYLLFINTALEYGIY